MLINNYIKSRKYLFILSIIILLILAVTTRNKEVKNSFSTYFKEELKKYKLTLTELQKINTIYSFKYRNIFFIAKKNGLNEVFKGDLRTTNNGRIISLKNIKQLTNTPLSDEEIIYSDNKSFVYKNSFKSHIIISIIRKDKLIHIRYKRIENSIVKYSINKLSINNKSYNISELKNNKKFIIYEESINKKKIKFSNNLNNVLKINKFKTEYKYIKTFKISTDKERPFKYFKVQIPKKDSFEIYFFEKKNYFLKLIDSGGIKHTKTGLIFKNKKYNNKNNIYIDFKAKGGFKIKSDLIRPILNNYPTILINSKNNISYGFLKKRVKENTDLLQFGYPLIFKNKKSVEIENLRNNLKEDAKKNKLRTGICLKDNTIGFFNLFGSRNLLTDYLYLINCNYAVETNSMNISLNEIKNSMPKMILTPKNQKINKLNFKKYKFLEKYDDDLLSIYKIPCNSLKLSYKPGKSDPLINKKTNSENIKSKSIIPIYSGSIDPINPDTIYSNNEEYYPKQKNDKLFLISSSECKIGELSNSEYISFYKKGALLLENNKTYEIQNKKYQKILSAIAIKDETIFIYQFKKPTDYKKLFLYNDEINPYKIISFENYNGEFDKKSGQLIIHDLKKGKEIYSFESN